MCRRIAFSQQSQLGLQGGGLPGTRGPVGGWGEGGGGEWGGRRAPGGWSPSALGGGLQDHVTAPAEAPAADAILSLGPFYHKLRKQLDQFTLATAPYTSTV